MKSRMGTIRIPAVALVGLISLVTSGNAAVRQIEVTGTYVHQPTRRQFPERVGEFRRDKVLQYDAEGHHISVGYNLEAPNRLIAATLYIRPLAGQTFSDELSEVRAAHPDVVVEFEQELILERGSQHQACHNAGLSYKGPFAHRVRPVTSYLLVCDDPPWRFKWRFTHLPTSDKDINRVMKDLAAALTVQ